MHDIRINLENSNLEPRQTVRGKVNWRLNAPPEALEIHLLWYTSGKGDRDSGLVKNKRVEHIGASGEEEFEFLLPREPYSFSGKLISVVWAIEVVIEPEGEVVLQDFVMGPSGKEVQAVHAGA